MWTRQCRCKVVVISIHALREEGDPDRYDASDDARKFLSTPSARRATDLYRFIADFGVISIHALREEGDSITFTRQTVFCDFYPRPPRGGRPTHCLL